MKKGIIITASALGLIFSVQSFARDINVEEDNVAVLPILSNVAQDGSNANSGVQTDDVLSNNDILSHNDLLSNNDLFSNNSADFSEHLHIDTEVKVNATVASTSLSGSVDGNGLANGGDGPEGEGAGIDDDMLLALGLGIGVGVGAGDAGMGGTIGSATTNTVSGGAFSGASGIMNTAQTGGANALAQQGVTVQANLHLGGRR